MIRKRYNNRERNIYIKEPAQTESQENSPFPADGSRVILNKSKNDNK